MLRRQCTDFRVHHRNSLVCNMLSYVDFYKPKFFLLENVLGLLHHKLQINKLVPQEGEMVANGVIKFILRTLTSLGYVVAFDTCFDILPSPRTLTNALG